MWNTGRIDCTIDSGVATPAGAVGSVDIDGQMCNHDSSPDFDDEAWTEAEMEFEESCAEFIGCAMHASNDDWERAPALLLLNVKERFKLTQLAVDFIIQEMHHIIAYGVDDIQKVVQWLDTQGIVANLAELATLLEPFQNPFVGIETEYMSSNYYQDDFNLVVRNIDLLLMRICIVMFIASF